jgi:N-acetylmuramoyl-L-alanine amidase
VVGQVLNKKILFILTKGGKKLLILILCVILVSMLINTAIFTGINGKNSLEGMSVIIDPGHGGIDGGTGKEHGVLEKDINLQIAARLKRNLMHNKVFVDMTRESDMALDDRNSLSGSRHVRDLMARLEQFNSGKYDLFISIHANSSPRSSSVGPLVLYSARIPESAILGGCIQECLNSLAESRLGERAVHRSVVSDFFILENSNIPGVIVETGFITNSLEKELLQDEDYQSGLVASITEGIRDYIKEIRKAQKANKSKKPENDRDIPINNIDEFELIKK